ncbi:MAG: nucleoid-associated protein [Bacteroidota bacterium]|nr:nucleoid-associated protein [Bacteroidota bacterium]
MLNFNEINIEQVIVHHVGSQPDDEGVQFSNAPMHLNDDLTRELLQRYFLTPFKPGEYYHLSHESDINLNAVYTLALNIFSDPDSFTEQSQHLATHLYEQSTHPKIKTGELYVVHFSNCFIEGETVDAIGLFKSESKETFLKVQSNNGNFEINYDSGVNINKLDKGCLIFNLEEEDGYLLSIVDTVNKGNEAQYWREDFLQVKARKDEYHQTKSYLDMCKTFVLEQVPKEFETTKADQAEFLNKSVSFFKEKEDFSFDEFAGEVIQQPEVIESFKEYKKQYEVENDVHIEDEFAISAPAVKKESKVFKSVIKLDKNFHIYVHGGREYIVKGFDEEKGMQYYKLYFKDEVAEKG